MAPARMNVDHDLGDWREVEDGSGAVVLDPDQIMEDDDAWGGWSENIVGDVDDDLDDDEAYFLDDDDDDDDDFSDDYDDDDFEDEEFEDDSEEEIDDDEL